MDCPKCNKPMQKVRSDNTNNLKTGKDFKGYDKSTYECQDDDIWVITEIPIAKKPNSRA